MAVQYDAFGNPINLIDPLEQKTTYNIYENRPFASGQGANLQNVYGTKAMPMFEFIRQIKVGERTYDPNKPEDREYQRQYEAYQQQNPQAPTWGQVIGETAMGIAPVVGSAVGEALVNPGGYYQGDALSRAGQGFMDTFSTSPSKLVNEAYQGFDPAKYVNQSGVPFGTSGNKDLLVN